MSDHVARARWLLQTRRYKDAESALMCLLLSRGGRSCCIPLLLYNLQPFYYRLQEQENLPDSLF